MDEMIRLSAAAGKAEHKTALCAEGGIFMNVKGKVTLITGGAGGL